MYLRLGNHQASSFLGLETTRSGHLSSRIEYVDGDPDTLFSFSSDTKLPVNDFSDGDIAKPSLLSAAMFTFSLYARARACQRVAAYVHAFSRAHAVSDGNDALSNTGNRYFHIRQRAAEYQRASKYL